MLDLTHGEIKVPGTGSMNGVLKTVVVAIFKHSKAAAVAVAQQAGRQDWVDQRAAQCHGVRQDTVCALLWGREGRVLQYRACSRNLLLSSIVVKWLFSYYRCS